VELWISYNSISSLDSVLRLTKLQVLYCSNNVIKDWGDIEKLSALTELREVLFRGNPIYTDLVDDATARLQFVKHLPSLQKVDARQAHLRRRPHRRRRTEARGGQRGGEGRRSMHLSEVEGSWKGCGDKL
jgi:hypothetical protein